MVSQMRGYGEQERERDLATSAAGMADATRENLIGYLTERGLAITPEVDEAVRQISTSLTIDWSDKNNVDAVFGTLTKSLENGGPAEAAKVMGQMAEFNNIAMGNPTFNRSEMLNIINHWLKGDIDPKELAVRTRAFLDSATKDWSDPMSAMGIDNPQKAEKARQARLIFMNILASLSERPDQQQKVVTEGARAWQAYRQNLFRQWSAVGRAISPEVYNMMGWAGGVAGGGGPLGADFLGNYNSPAAARMRAVLQSGAGAASVPQFLQLPVGQYGNTIGGAAPLNPQMANPAFLPRQRAAATESRFVRLAQIRPNVYNPSIGGGQVVPRTDTPSNNPTGERDAWQQDAMKSMLENMGSAEAAELTFNQILGVEKTQRLQQLKFDNGRLEQNLSAWEQDIRTGRGVADLRLIGNVDQMLQQLAMQSNSIMSIYDEAMSQLVQQRAMVQQQLMQSGGQDPNLQREMQRLDMGLSGIAQQRNEQRVQRDQNLLRGQQMSNQLRFQARQEMTVNPLREQRDVLREGLGADAGASLALSAAEMQQARERMQQFQKLQGLDPNVAGVQMGKAYTDAMKAYRAALQDIDRSGTPAIPDSKLLETQGV